MRKLRRETTGTERTVYLVSFETWELDDYLYHQSGYELDVLAFTKTAHKVQMI